ncbi:MAG: hypothetical protein KGH66_02700, partial [Candidatus Micrarchaeota archaeon]|nr:hypothetical protein [Candidatus Micrarchaeota archaeon]
ATNYSSVCLATLCHGTVNVTSALRSMEYDMMYNDLQCCGNGHRDNILDPNHTSVSIGISYNSSRIYLTQDFIDDYISWAAGPGYAANGEVTLQGQTGGGTGMDSIEISYDPPIANMTRAQLNATTDYGYGNPIAGVVSNPSLYYSGITTITADRYQVSGNQFDIRFNMQSLVNQYGAGEYTLLMFLNRTGAPGSFLGSTYTIFINGQGAAYAPTNV